MKKWLLLLISGIVLVVAIFLITFYSWGYFNQRKPKVDLNTLEIVLSDDGEVNLKEQTPTEDNKSDDIIPYNFKVTNKSDTKAKYQILLEDFISDDSNALLSRNVLKYELKKDGVTIKSGDLSSIKNNILNENSINAKEEDKYELRIWVNNDVSASEWVGKTYNYNVKVKPLLN